MPAVNFGRERLGAKSNSWIEKATARSTPKVQSKKSKRFLLWNRISVAGNCSCMLSNHSVSVGFRVCSRSCKFCGFRIGSTSIESPSPQQTCVSCFRPKNRFKRRLSAKKRSLISHQSSLSASALNKHPAWTIYTSPPWSSLKYFVKYLGWVFNIINHRFTREWGKRSAQKRFWIYSPIIAHPTSSSPLSHLLAQSCT